MWLTEQVLYRLARAMHRSEVAHSSEMKSALRNIDAYDTYRSMETDRILAAVERLRIPLTGQTVVDFGCSDGAISARYLRSGAAAVVGVDIDERALRRARALHRDRRLTFVKSGVDTIPLDDCSADVVISYDVFEHVSRPVPILSELGRILRPGGKALIGTWSWYHPFAPHLWAVMPVPWAHLVVSERTLLRACRRVYRSAWYVPNMHDYDENGRRLADKYTADAISPDYLNKLRIKDFERAFAASGFGFETHPVPFGSRYARYARPLAHLPWTREFLAGYVWFVLTNSDRTALAQQRAVAGTTVA